ncbi:glycoside hydrolase [Rozella allomycis CSF55]|uniref:beta-mannosidase n=1 Tax=Rozella allomycis (strain CSF55) TaxID=988480 RepID=A0A4P9YF83_ROZAC|nr:glycoside hydrolase [Rozella allomycis CSF55]
MVELWYPIGYGKSKLYNLKIDVYDVEMHMRVFSKTISIGFRYSELDMERKFVISVNGRKIFCKGANIVPIDLDETKVNKERLEKIIRKCVAANMNCIRVWGGGTYLPDFFYELCDEYGIMVWQESCAMYPTNSEFLENVEREIEYQSNRLGRFACIVLWSGNNENEEILVKGWFEPVKRNPFLYSIDYYILNNCILDSLRSTGYVGPYVSSSPSNGCFLNDPRRERFAQLPYTGDTHYYNYEDDARDTSKLPITNFASEFGYQSMPNYHDLRKVVECTDDLNFFSDFMIQRNHHLNGQTQMMNLMQKVFPFISECDEFEFQVYSSQIVQGWMLQSQIDHYRRLQFEGNCMGALYWQLNDVWTCPSWSTLTENGDCKLSHYFIKRAFEPIRITMHKVGNKLVVWMINDTDKIIDGVVEIEIYGMTVEKTILEVKMDARRGKKIVEMNYFNQSFLRAKFRHKDGNILAEEDFAEITSRNKVAPLVKYCFQHE